MEDFRDIELAHDELLADEAGQSIEEKLAALTLNNECVFCGEEIPHGRATLGATSCGECKPQTVAASRRAA